MSSIHGPHTARLSEKSRRWFGVMALEIGAAFTVVHWNLSIKLGRYVMGERWTANRSCVSLGPHEVGHPHGILVNAADHRFADESSFGDVASKLRQYEVGSHQLVNLRCFFVSDQRECTSTACPDSTRSRATRLSAAREYACESSQNYGRRSDESLASASEWWLHLFEMITGIVYRVSR